MTINLSAVADRKIALWQKIRDLAKDPEAMELLLELVGSNGSKGDSPIADQQLPLQPTAATIQPTLVNKVLEIIKSGGEYTVPVLVKQLHDVGWKFAAKDEVVSVGTAVRTLAERNAIRVVSAGSGRTPKVYAAMEKRGDNN